MAPLTPIRISLDWTPNTLHTGLYLAATHSLYANAGLSVTFIFPDPSSPLTPSRRVQNGLADLAICPSESCIAFAESGKMHLQAVYAILQRDGSAIVSKFGSGVEKLADLGAGGKVYGSYNARYEDSIVRTMVSNDGGDGKAVRIEGQKGQSKLFEAVKKGGEGVDATWIFLPWEGVEAEVDGVPLNLFTPTEHGVPYGYSPVIARKVGEGGLSDEMLGKFVKATREGYETARRDVGAAVECMKAVATEARGEEFWRKSQESVNTLSSDGGELGTMKGEKWEGWVAWLEGRGLVEKGKVDAEKLYSNAFFA